MSAPTLTSANRFLVVAVSVIACLALVESSTFTYVLPSLLQDLGLGGSATLVRITPSLGALLVVFVAGTLGTRWGHRRTMIVAACLLTAGSALTLAAMNLPMVIVGIFLSNIGRNTLLICGVALVGLHIEGKNARASAFAMYAAILPVTYLFMPIGAGWLVDNLGWRSVAAMWILAGLVSIVLVLRAIPAPTELDPHAELLTPILAGICLGGVVQAISTYGRDGSNAVFWLEVAITVGVALALAIALRRIENPSLSLSILRHGGVLILLTIVVLANFANLWFYISLAFQQAFHFSALHSALLALPAQAITIVAAGTAGWLVRKRGIRFSGTAFLIAGGASLLLSATLTVATPVWITVMTLVLFAAASTGASVPITNAVMDSMPRDQSNQAASFRSAANSFGVAVSVAVTSTLVFGTMLRDLVSAGVSMGLSESTAIDLVTRLERGAEYQQIVDEASRTSVVITVEGTESAVDAAYMHGLNAHGLVGAIVIFIVAATFFYARGRQERAGAVEPAAASH